MLTEDKNVKRDTNALAMLFFYLYSKLDSAIEDGSSVLSENKLSVVFDLKDKIEVYG